jgi:FAD/FMN-containing dehydrogenase
VRGVRVEAVDDVQKAVRFASLHDLRVVVKSSGHDFLGRSAAAGSFLIWMHKLKSIRIHEPWGGCGVYSEAAITVVGGVSWGEVYDALKGTGHVVVGGMSLTVSATGGYVQGGGHGALSPSLGLAVDNVLQMEVVTADGALRVTNACQEPDLFFALRGGGGGTFGVVISVTYKLHPNPPNLVATVLQLNPPRGSTTWITKTQEEILAVWSHGTVSLDAARWTGYWSFSASRFFGNFLVPATEAAATEAFTPLVQLLSRIDNVTVSLYLMSSFATFQDWHSWIYDLVYPETHTDYTGSYVVLGSRIVPFSALDDPRRVAKAIVAGLAVSRGVLGHMVIGPGVRAGDHMAVTPAWRAGVWHLTGSWSWSWNATGVEKRAARAQARRFAEVLQSAFPDSGAYVNEASVDEPGWAASFWGRENYARLVAIKSRVDPCGLFVCRQCVGSELWDEDGNCRDERSCRERERERNC